MCAEGVEVARVQFQTSARHEKGAGHPAGRQSDYALAGRESFPYFRDFGHGYFLAGTFSTIGPEAYSLLVGSRFDVTRKHDGLVDGFGVRESLQGEGNVVLVFVDQDAVEADVGHDDGGRQIVDFHRHAAAEIVVAMDLDIHRRALAWLQHHLTSPGFHGDVGLWHEGDQLELVVGAGVMG